MTTTDILPGGIRAPVATETATCANCSGMRWVKHYWPPEGKHTRHDAGCERKYGYCIRKCSVCAQGIQAGQVTHDLYTWLGDEAGDLPTKRLATFNRPAQVEAYDVAEMWLARALRNASGLENIVLKGNPGTGKTHLVAALVNALNDAGIGCLFAVVPSFFEAYYVKDFEKKLGLMSRAQTIAVLVLDDLDKLHVPTATDGAYQKKTLFELLNGRYVAHKPTLITTNAQGSLKAWMDDATISRLMQRAKLVPMNGADYRQRRKDGAR